MRLHCDSLAGMEQIGIATLRPNLTAILKRVQTGATIVAVHHEHPRAVLVPPERYQAIQETLRQAGIDPDTLAPIGRSGGVPISGGGMTDADEFFGKDIRVYGETGGDPA